jgi:glycosyltransferase involved in cell wall biosynthesis
MARSTVALRRLLCVAPLVPAGGVDTVLTAFGMLADDRPDLSLEVVGGGMLSRVLHAQAAYLGLDERVDFRGRLSAPAVRTAVRGCAVLVLPHRDDGAAATSAAEAALLEARASACPVVATPHAAQPDLPGTGLVVPPDAPTVLARALVSALDTGDRPATVVEPDLLRRAWHRVLG